MKRLIILVPLILFVLWVKYCNVTSDFVWVGFVIAIIWVIALDLLIIPKKNLRIEDEINRKDVFGDMIDI